MEGFTCMVKERSCYVARQCNAKEKSKGMSMGGVPQIFCLAGRIPSAVQNVSETDNASLAVEYWNANPPRTNSQPKKLETPDVKDAPTKNRHPPLSYRIEVSTPVHELHRTINTRTASVNKKPLIISLYDVLFQST
jgi:hypothetical protein